jgi:2-amino-4-hydroxy-6-hydroxymethyldihydropteridine diphosphokinase
MARAVLGLGANIGDPLAQIRGAVQGLRASRQLDLISVSGLWRTSPVGGPEQPSFLNAVALVSTTVDPSALLGIAHDLEAAASRERLVRWGPRTLDVDLLDVTGVRLNTEYLTVPHPRAHLRAFVLAPWAQVAPDWVLEVGSGERLTVAAHLDLLLAREASQDFAEIDPDGWWE